MVIREAVKEDIPQLVALGEEFANVSQVAHGFSISKEKIINFAHETVEKHNWIVLLIEEAGIINGLLVASINSPFFSNDIIAQEIVWYVRKECRSGPRLFFELEKLVKRKGIKKLAMGYKPHFIDMRDFYLHRNYRLLEAYYIKEIS